MPKTKHSNFNNPKNLLVALFVILIISIIGAYLLKGSNAATPTYHQFLNFTARAQTAGVHDIQAQVNNLGEQTVSSIDPGAQLDYQTGSKVAYKNQCYYYTILPNKGGSETAKIQFVGQGAAATVSVIYSPEKAGYWRRTCVGSGTQVQKAYNVANLSPVGGPNVLVYQDDISF